MKIDTLKKHIVLLLTLALSTCGIVYADTTAPAGQGGQRPNGTPPAAQGTLLQEYVTSGVLTQAELDKINAFLTAQEAARKTEMDAAMAQGEPPAKADPGTERPERITLRQQLLDNSLISTAQSDAIDWTKFERGERPQDNGTATANGTEKAGFGTNTSGNTNIPAAAAQKGITVLLNGVELKSSVSPHLDKNGRTLIELRSVAEALGAEIAWNADTQTVTLSTDSTTVNIQINKAAYRVNNAAKTMDTAAVIENGRTMVPLRVIAEALGATVSYDSNTKTITITQ